MKKLILPYYKLENTSHYVFVMLNVLAGWGVVFGLCVQGPVRALEGLWQIIISSDALISDYVEIGGLGAAFLNAGLVMGIALLIQKRLKLPFSGMSIACSMLMFGFALFGKNVVNILPIIFGGWLYSKMQKEHFAKSIYAVLFGTCLAPVSTEVAMKLGNSPLEAVIIAFLIGAFIGFIIAPVSSFTMRLHMGYSLYNTGFAAGMISFIFTSLLRAGGFEFSSNMMWDTNHTIDIIIFLGVFFVAIFALGFIWNGNSLYGYKKLLKRTGRAVCDFTLLDGLPLTLVNMGALGVLSIIYILLIGAPLNGPVAGGILSIVGFGAFGKHIKNVTPVVLGVVLASCVMHWDLTEPAMVLAALFVTALAPIAGHFGWFWGLVVGIVHSSVIRDVGMLHGWLNLYNNGFAAGFICVVMVPFIEAWNLAEEDDEKANWFVVTPLLNKVKKLVKKDRKS